MSEDWNLKVLEQHYTKWERLKRAKGVLWSMLSLEAQRVCKSLFDDPKFMYYPASKHYRDRDGKLKPGKHHCWPGGLIQHKTEVLRNALAAAHHYDIDRVVLECGCLFHDSGKLDEYGVTVTKSHLTFSEGGTTPVLAGEGVHFEATSTREPRLNSHLPLSIARWAKAAEDASELSSPQYDHVMHLIVSHHGFRMWGSPDAPRTMEAVLLHHADVLSVVGSCGSSPYCRD